MKYSSTAQIRQPHQNQIPSMTRIPRKIQETNLCLSPATE